MGGGWGPPLSLPSASRRQRFFAICQQTAKNWRTTKSFFAVCQFFAVCFLVADGKELLCRQLADGKELADGKLARCVGQPTRAEPMERHTSPKILCLASNSEFVSFLCPLL